MKYLIKSIDVDWEASSFPFEVEEEDRAELVAQLCREVECPDEAGVKNFVEEAHPWSVTSYDFEAVE